MNSAPPPKPPKPGQVKVVRALFKYDAQYPDELSFEEGEILYIIGIAADPNWFQARTGTNTAGLIPSNYIDENVEIIATPLLDACKRGNIALLKEAILNGVSVNQLDKAGCTALYWAAHGGHIPCILLLLESKNIDINVQNKLGDTALHAAAWKGHIVAVKVLLDSGASLNIANCEGKTASSLAKDPEIIDMIAKQQNPQEQVNTNVDADYFASGDEIDSD